MSSRDNVTELQIKFPAQEHVQWIVPNAEFFHLCSRANKGNKTLALNDDILIPPTKEK